MAALVWGDGSFARKMKNCQLAIFNYSIYKQWLDIFRRGSR
jgi:hypothetical protein